MVAGWQVHSFLALYSARLGVFLISPLGGPERKVASATCDCSADSHITWSPDGKLLAFLDHPESYYLNVVESDLVVVSLDSMERLRGENWLQSGGRTCFFTTRRQSRMDMRRQPQQRSYLFAATKRWQHYSAIARSRWDWRPGLVR